MEHVECEYSGCGEPQDQRDRLPRPAGATVLEAAHGAGIAIPTLCYLKELNAIGACRICVVEVKGAKNLVPACVYPIADGMECTPIPSGSRRHGGPT